MTRQQKCIEGVAFALIVIAALCQAAPGWCYCGSGDVTDHQTGIRYFEMPLCFTAEDHVACYFLTNLFVEIDIRLPSGQYSTADVWPCTTDDGYSCGDYIEGE